MPFFYPHNPGHAGPPACFPAVDPEPQRGEVSGLGHTAGEGSSAFARRSPGLLLSAEVLSSSEPYVFDGEMEVQREWGAAGSPRDSSHRGGLGRGCQV